VHICYGYGIQANIDWKKTLGGEWRQYAEIFPALAESRIKQVSLECINSKVPIQLLKLLKGKDVLVGVIDVATDRIESPEEVSDVIERALQYVPAKHLFPCTNCGMAPMDREVALQKLRALAAGAALARKRLTSNKRKKERSRTSRRAGHSRPRAAPSPRRSARRK
jgi:5-methyltetrahydropteroyltriglutamate--homocysteine methyltransferase